MTIKHAPRDKYGPHYDAMGWYKPRRRPMPMGVAVAVMVVGLVAVWMVG